MLSQNQVLELISKIPQSASNHDRRVACSVIVGVRDEKTLSEIVKYYWLPEEDAKTWWEFYGFDNVTKRERQKRTSKSSAIDDFVKSNIGKTLKTSDIISLTGITAPTFYNYLNANRGWFKKSARGEYTIVDPEELRKEEKSNK